ncbi:Cytochrome p450 protein [Pleurostoma richardsiae]|uniref:Cytochrome p450 protein n=1 Tax=Pleurostoma richardsiae TaxID=41990 RepID=A0AA38RN38_9PEZI|nr:Cytochrome p450 protein [Pleurostoma richardsiae]
MVLKGGAYVKSLGLRNRDKPIFTLPVPASRIYIVTDPSLAAAVQRASKALSFTPLVPDITRRVLGLDAAAADALRQNIDPEPGDPRGFLADMHDMVYGFLGPGEDLDALTLDAAAELAAQVNTYAEEARGRLPDGEVVDLLSWVRHFVTVGTARFLYGQENPLALHPELEQAFWDFDHGLGGLLMGVLPSVTARKPYKRREAIVAAFTEYLEAGVHLEASRIVRNRVEIAERYGWPPSRTARSELSFLFAGIVNTATATFWTVLRVFADRALLQAVRAELGAAATAGKGEEGGSSGGDDRNHLLLSVQAVRAGCPTLHAVLRECLRLGSDNFSTRLVKADTLLAERYFLRQGSVVQIAGGVIHADRSLWGDDAEEFNPRRFLEEEDGGGKRRRKEHPAAFRAFGGGKTLCPGRHFATAEIMAFVAMIVLMFDPEAPDGGKIGVPNKDDHVLPVHILEPKAKDAVRVRIRVRGVDETRHVKVIQ